MRGNRSCVFKHALFNCIDLGATFPLRPSHLCILLVLRGWVGSGWRILPFRAASSKTCQIRSNQNNISFRCVAMMFQSNSVKLKQRPTMIFSETTKAQAVLVFDVVFTWLCTPGLAYFSFMTLYTVGLDQHPDHMF